MDENTQKLEADPIEGEAEDPAVSEVETEARSNGWVPKDQFKGKESDWVDASTWVQQGRAIKPILKQNNQRLERELREAKGELEELKLTTKEFAAEFAKMRENAYKRAIGELKAQRREALKEEDHDAVEALEERIDSLKEEQAAKKPEVAKSAAPDLTEFNEWHRENKWYDEQKEPDLFDAAEAISLRLSRNEPGLKGRPFMDRVTELVKAKFPDKFENPRRKAAPHDGGGSRGESKGGKGYASLPAEAKQACDRYVKQGIMTKEAYLDAYEWD